MIERESFSCKMMEVQELGRYCRTSLNCTGNSIQGVPVKIPAASTFHPLIKITMNALTKAQASGKHVDYAPRTREKCAFVAL